MSSYQITVRIPVRPAPANNCRSEIVARRGEMNTQRTTIEWCFAH